MNELFFKVERAGIFSTFQDEGYSNLQHLGISSGGVMDINLFKLSNKLLHNSLNEGVIEFAYQGPRLKLIKGTAKIVVTGNVHFNMGGMPGGGVRIFRHGVPVNINKKPDNVNASLENHS